ncbi:hypothetical protein DYB28_000327 [Aphanomyces astaci]|uniref:Protein kinase domain-containing protein n=2 Tax=Aphanomyces astaci TaxID=112090 RepID=A0A9X8H3C5_APHAT|nr:hypothetical protein DYB28_000327 [Aphanomyces astaci]
MKSVSPTSTRPPNGGATHDGGAVDGFGEGVVGVRVPLPHAPPTELANAPMSTGPMEQGGIWLITGISGLHSEAAQTSATLASVRGAVGGMNDTLVAVWHSAALAITGANAWTNAVMLHAGGKSAASTDDNDFNNRTGTARHEAPYMGSQAAVSYNHTELVQYLLAGGASATLSDFDSETPLHFCESVEIAQILLARGADINAKNADLRTPLDSALDDENEELVAFYEANGAVSSGIVSEESASLAQLQAMMEAQENADGHNATFMAGSTADDALGRRLRRQLGSYAHDNSGEMSTTAIGLIASVSTLVVLALLFLACRLSSRLQQRHHALLREVRRIQATRAVMERSNQTSYQFAYDNVSGVAGQVQLAHDVRFDPSFAHTRIPHHELYNLRLVAKRSGTVVFQAIFNNMDIAVKQLLPSQCNSLLIVTDFMREIRLAATLEHPNIVGFIGLAWTEGASLADLSLLTEFMPNGMSRANTPLATPMSSIRSTLSGHYQSSRHRMRRELLEQGTSKASLAAEVADALAYLHSFEPTVSTSRCLVDVLILRFCNCQVIHRDLKSKNILLSRTWNARLNDFGYSRVTNPDDLMTMNVGTIAWIAPEVLTGGRYTEQADIYSFGVLLSELDTLQVPYTELTREYIDEHHHELSSDLHHPKVKAKAKSLSNAYIAMSVAEGRLSPSFTNLIPHELLVLARECLSHAPQNRPTAIELSYRLRSFILGV